MSWASLSNRNDSCHENFSWYQEKSSFNFKTSLVLIYSEFYFQLYVKEVLKPQKDVEGTIQHG